MREGEEKSNGHDYHREELPKWREEDALLSGRRDNENMGARLYLVPCQELAMSIVPTHYSTKLPQYLIDLY